MQLQMHELSIALSLVDAIGEELPSLGAVSIRSVRVARRSNRETERAQGRRAIARRGDQRAITPQITRSPALPAGSVL